MSKPTVSGPKIAPSKPPACTRPDARVRALHGGTGGTRSVSSSLHGTLNRVWCGTRWDPVGFFVGLYTPFGFYNAN